jgi:hypothetical protein
MSLEDNLAQAAADIGRVQARAQAAGVMLPKPPEQLDASACCGRGCHPCMFTYYFDALDAWREKAEALLKG